MRTIESVTKDLNYALNEATMGFCNKNDDVLDYYMAEVHKFSEERDYVRMTQLWNLWNGGIQHHSN